MSIDSKSDSKSSSELGAKLDPRSWIQETSQYFEEVRAEGKKVVWPSFVETRIGTIGVVVLVAFFAVLLGLVDFTLSKLMQLLLPS